MVFNPFYVTRDCLVCYADVKQVRGSPFRFPSIGSTSPLLFLAKGYAILDGPTFPIIGEADQEANDTYIEQLVASAEAAVDEVVKRGVTQRFSTRRSLSLSLSMIP